MNPKKIISISSKAKWKDPKFIKKQKSVLKSRIEKMKKSKVKHHINLDKSNNNPGNILFLTFSKHTLLHLKAYEYFVHLGIIKKYIKWFNRNYKLKE